MVVNALPHIGKLPKIMASVRRCPNNHPDLELFLGQGSNDGKEESWWTPTYLKVPWISLGLCKTEKVGTYTRVS